MSISSFKAKAKHVLADLPAIRTAAVAALATAGAVMVLIPHSTGTGAAVVSGITGASSFLSNPKVIQILADIAAAAASFFRG